MIPRKPDWPSSSPLSSSGRPILLGRWQIAPDTTYGYEWEPPMPPRLMVPDQRGRWLTLHPPGLGPIEITNASDSGVIPDALGEPCCRATLNGRLLSVYGMNRARRTSIDVRQGGSQLSIRVTLKTTLEVPIIAHYVEQGPLWKTRMTSEMLAQMIAAANRLLEPQANVRVKLTGERILPYTDLDRPLGKAVLSAEGTKRDEWPIVTKHAVRTGEPRLLNLFLVRRFDNPGGEPLAETTDGCCIFEDRISGGSLEVQRAGGTLAHEIGHHLSLSDLYDKADENRLMYCQEGGKFLSALEADQINPTGVGGSP